VAEKALQEQRNLIPAEADLPTAGGYAAPKARMGYNFRNVRSQNRQVA